MTRARPNWDHITQQATNNNPHLANGNLSVAVTDALHRDEDILAGILRDIIKADEAPTQPGVRVMPAQAIGEARLNELRSGGCSLAPFPVALRHLIAGRSQRHAATKAGISRPMLQRFLSGRERPTVGEMAQIAEAFGKRPWYFAEWRIATITQAVADHFSTNPEQSIPLAKRLAGVTR